MQPLSPRKRRLYLYSLVVLFLILFPIVVLYAGGYRFKGEFGFVQTGGIYVDVPYSDAVISLNGEEVGESGILRRSFYVSDLSPGTYIVQAIREDMYPWNKTLVVESELVTDAHVLLIPEDPKVVELSFAQNAPTTTERISKTVFDQYLAAFKRPAATTTGMSGGTLFLENGNVFLRWTNAGGTRPSSFCVEPSRCVTEIPVETSKQEAIAIAPFAGGVVYATAEAGVYITEADIRPTDVFAPLYPVRGATFRIIDERLIIKDGNKLYEIQEL